MGIENAPVKTAKEPRSGSQTEIPAEIAGLVELNRTLNSISEAIEFVQESKIEILADIFAKLFPRIVKYKNAIAHSKRSKNAWRSPSIERAVENFEAVTLRFEQALMQRFSLKLAELESASEIAEDFYLILLSFLVNSSDSAIAKKSIEYLAKNLELVAEGKSKLTPENVMPIGLAFSQMAKKENLVSEEMLFGLFMGMLAHNPGKFSEISRIVALLYTWPASKSFARKILKFFLDDGFGVSSKDFLSAWQSNAQVGTLTEKKKDGGKETFEYSATEAADDLGQIIQRNLLCMNEIEKRKKGACRFLYENYGIRNFARFNEDIWLAQYEAKEKQGPWGLVVSGRDDWNGSSYDEEAGKTYEKLWHKIQSSHVLRIIEVEDLPRLARKLNLLKRKYALSPSFAVWSGHGNKNEFFLGRMKFGKRHYRSFLHKTDFEDEPGQRMDKYLSFFASETVMILDGCSYEAEANLPATVAKITGNQVIYPKGITQVADFGVTTNADGKLSFNVKYHHDIETVVAKK